MRAKPRHEMKQAPHRWEQGLQTLALHEIGCASAVGTYVISGRAVIVARERRVLGNDFQVFRAHLPATAVSYELEADLLTFAKIAEPRALDSADVNEGILAAVIGCNKAEALLRVEPLHGSSRHRTYFLLSFEARNSAKPYEIECLVEKEA